MEEKTKWWSCIVDVFRYGLHGKALQERALDTQAQVFRQLFGYVADCIEDGNIDEALEWARSNGPYDAEEE